MNANCENIPGSFSCICKPEYSGDGFNCEGILLFIYLFIYLFYFEVGFFFFFCGWRFEISIE